MTRDPSSLDRRDFLKTTTAAGAGLLAASTGAACHSGLVELSPVLRAMGVAPEIGMGAIRFSLGRGTTEEEIDAIVAQLRQTVATQGS